MINKKVILGILTLGMLAVVAGGTTWAYMQDTLTSSNNGVQTATPVTLTGIELKNIIPITTGQGSTLSATNGKPYYTLLLRNNNANGIPTDVYFYLTPVKSDVVPDVALYMDSRTIYDSTGAWYSYTDPKTPSKVTTLAPGGASADESFKYSFIDTGKNQNTEEGKEVTFNANFFVVPSGSAAHTS
jgi:predicted ribosomally synthesized peptide with SipW-like signal peptide